MTTSNQRTVLRILPVVGLALLSIACSRRAPGTFDDPAEALQAVHDLIGQNDPAKIEAVFGPGSADMFDSGDAVADASDQATVKTLIEQGVRFESLDETTTIALLGKGEWPFPVPLVKDGKSWRFDAAKGREEIANRHVGRNEILTLASLHAFVDAQHEYAKSGRDGLPPQYARRFLSSEGLHDGLYWPAAEGEPESPLGELIAMAAARGYVAPSGADAPPAPFNGYLYRILEAQGPAAPGGARDYVDASGHMTGGFACLAWPVKHGVSGIMSFMVSDRGLVFQKDLGDATDTAAAAIRAYDPDDTWAPAWAPADVAGEDGTASAAAPPATPVQVTGGAIEGP